MTLKKEIILDNTDSSFSTEAAFLYECNWLLEEDVLHISIIGEKVRKLLKIESYDLSDTPAPHREDLLKEILANHNKILDNSSSNQFIHVSSDFSLVPHAFNEENTYSRIYGGLLEIDSEISTSKIQHLNLDLVTSHPLTRILPVGQFSKNHFIGKLIQYCSANYASSDENVAVTYQLKESTFILLFRNEKLIVANQYPVKEPADVSYFVFASMKSYDIKPGLTTLYFGGYLQESETLIGIFNKYVHEVYRMNPVIEYRGNFEDTAPILTADICSA